MAAEQTLRLFVKCLSERKGIEKNLWAKKFIKRIVYSKEEILVTLYYKRSFGEEDMAIFSSGRGAAATAENARFCSGQKIIPTGTCRDNHEEWLPSSNSIQTIDIILPNTIHGCKKKDL